MFKRPFKVAKPEADPWPFFDFFFSPTLSEDLQKG